MFTVRDLRGLTTEYQPGRLRPLTNLDGVSAPSTITPISAHGESAHHGSPPVASAIQRYLQQAQPEKTTPTAADIMTAPVEMVARDTSLADLVELFSKKRFRHYPVIDQKIGIVGIVSDRLAFKEALTSATTSKAPWGKVPLETIMISPVLTAAPHVPIREVARVLFQERIGCMPITSDTGEPIGIITRSDLLRAIVALTAMDLRI